MDIHTITNDYDQIYATHGLRASTKYYRRILSLLDIRKGRLLDIACGEGVLLREAKKIAPELKTFGLDISQEACKIAAKNSFGSVILQADGQRIPFKERLFDYVCCLGSLEHFIDPAVGVKEIVRLLKDKGIACIILPNSFSIDIILEVMIKGEDTSKFQIIERTDTKNNWVRFLEKNGLRVNKIYKSNIWPELFQEGTYKIKSIPKFIKRTIIKYICPLNLSREFLFICSKK